MQEMNKNMLNMQKVINTLASTGSSTFDPTIQVAPSSSSKPYNLDEYDGLFTSPFMDEIQKFPLPPEHKAPKFEMFSGEQDPKQYIISF